MGRVDGKVAVVTAAARNIGRASAEALGTIRHVVVDQNKQWNQLRFLQCETRVTAVNKSYWKQIKLSIPTLVCHRALAREGARVIATDINGEQLKELEAIKGIETAVLDVTDTKAVKEFVASLERIDVFFNCAGYVAMGPIVDCEEEEWDFTFNLNVKSMFRTCKAVIPKMLAQGGGSIINMASVCSTIIGVPSRSVYCASKAAVIGLSKSLAVDYCTNNIRINCICPGTIDTPQLWEEVEQSPDPAKALDKYVSRQKMRRLGKVEEIGHLVVYLASDESAYITGQQMIIDGGWSL